MKKLMFGLIAVFMLGSVASAQETTPPREDPPFFQLEFGRKSQDCGGFGICILRFNVTVQDVVNLVKAFAVPGGLFKISMTPEFYKNHSKAFQNGYLVVDEPYQLDAATTKKIGLREGFTIQKGKYKVVFDKATNTYNCTF